MKWILPFTLTFSSANVYFTGAKGAGLKGQASQDTRKTAVTQTEQPLRFSLIRKRARGLSGLAR